MVSSLDLQLNSQSERPKGDDVFQRLFTQKSSGSISIDGKDQRDALIAESLRQARHRL